MKDITLVIKPMTEKQSEQASIVNDYIKFLEENQFRNEGYLIEESTKAVIEYERLGDFSLMNVFIATLILLYEEVTKNCLSPFDKQLLYRYSFKLIMGSKLKVN